MFLFKSELNIYLRIPETPTALLRRRRVAILILGSVLLGAVLGRFLSVSTIW
jgi:LPS O-antigen subunit length determinant protein (WzzB/FepE family)